MCGKVLLLLHYLSAHVLLELLDVGPPLLDLGLEILLELVHPLDLLGYVLYALLDIGLRLRDVLFGEYGPHELVHGGIRAHQVELRQHHLVLALLLHQRLLRRVDLRVLCLNLFDLRHIGLQLALDLHLFVQEGLGNTRGDTCRHSIS